MFPQLGFEPAGLNPASFFLMRSDLFVFLMKPPHFIVTPAALLGLVVGLAGCDGAKTSQADPKPAVSVQAQPTAAPTAIARTTPAAAPVSAPAQPIPGPASSPPAAMADASPASSTLADRLNGIDRYSFAQRPDLITRVDALSTELDTVIAAARGEPPRTPKPESLDAHTTAFQNLDDARLALTQRRDALQYATVDTWESAKNDYRAAWQTTLAALAKVRSTGR